MKKLALQFFLIFCLPYFSFGQSDQNVANLLNKEDYIELKRVLPSVKDSIVNPMIRKLSEASICLAFSEDPMSRTQVIADLINNYGNELGFENVVGFAELLSQELVKYGNGADALNILEQFISITTDPQILSRLENTYKIVSGLNKIPGTSVIRDPAKSPNVKFSTDVKGSERLWYIPVEIEGNTEPFIFDTGAAESFISKSFAERYNIKIVADSILMNGVGGSEYVSLGVIDTLKVADIIYANMPVYIGQTDYPKDSITIEAVLGIPFMKNVGMIGIEPKKNEITFEGEQNGNTSANVSLHSNRMLIELYCKDIRLLMFCDTGAAMEGWINDSIYENHTELFEDVGQSYLIQSRGFAGISHLTVRDIPDVTLKAGKSSRSFTDFKLVDRCANDGELGVGFFKQFDKIEIDLSEHHILLQ